VLVHFSQDESTKRKRGERELTPGRSGAGGSVVLNVDGKNVVENSEVSGSEHPRLERENGGK